MSVRPTHPRPVARLVTIAATAAALLHPASAPAAEPDKAVCAEAYRSAQTQRKNGALERARASLLVCLSDRCPAVLQPDCTRWLTEVEAALPSVSFAARNREGEDVTSVRVSIDGKLLTSSLDGKAISLDPGSHTFRFEYGAEEPISQTIILREGEKARVVSVSWVKERPELTARAPSPVRTEGGAPASAWIFGGVGVASVATFGALAIHAVQRRSDLEQQCFGSCRQEDVDSIKTQLAIADVALGVGLVSLGISAVLFLSGGRSKSTTIGIGPTPIGGGAASLGGRF